MSLLSPPPDSYLLGWCRATGSVDFADLVLDVAWTPVAGPAVVQLVRSVNVVLLHAGGGVRVEVNELAELIGVAPTRFIHAVHRAEQFQLVRTGPTDSLFMPERLHIPSPEQQQAISVRSRELVEFSSRRGRSQI